MKVSAKTLHVILFYNRFILKVRRAHRYIRLSFVATTHGAAIIITQHNHWLIRKIGSKHSLAAHKKVITIYQRIHGNSIRCLAFHVHRRDNIVYGIQYRHKQQAFSLRCRLVCFHADRILDSAISKPVAPK